jgi:hypothetical protein
MNDPKNRPFTRFAAAILGPDAVKALDAGNCPCCKKSIGPFRNSLSQKEYGISGMCQNCQDSVFGDTDE